MDCGYQPEKLSGRASDWSCRGPSWVQFTVQLFSLHIFSEFPFFMLQKFQSWWIQLNTH